MRYLPVASLLLVVGLIAQPHPSHARATVQFSVLYQFRALNDGANPAGVVADRVGNLYGTTAGGGNSYGTIFELVRPSVPGGRWTETTLHRFVDARDGLYSLAGLAFDARGKLYGTTYGGGEGACSGGCGVVFELSPPKVGARQWTYNVLYRFKGGRDGARPYYGTLLLESGNVYGTTLLGGTLTLCSGEGCGIVFELTAPSARGRSWTERVIHRFGIGADGATPYNGIIADPRGNLFGAAGSGGKYNWGTIFELVRPPAARGTWVEQTLYTFGSTHLADGAQPASRLTFDDAGRLYGSTLFGGSPCAPQQCGTVFRLQPPACGRTWTEEQLYQFHGYDGEEPNSNVVLDRYGNIYGTTNLAGSKGYGTVFRLSLIRGAWRETPLHEFSRLDGRQPVGELLALGDGLYGVASTGGAAGVGLVYRVRPYKTN